MTSCVSSLHNLPSWLGFIKNGSVVVHGLFRAACHPDASLNGRDQPWGVYNGSILATLYLRYPPVQQISGMHSPPLWVAHGPSAKTQLRVVFKTKKLITSRAYSFCIRQRVVRNDSYLALLRCFAVVSFLYFCCTEEPWMQTLYPDQEVCRPL